MGTPVPQTAESIIIGALRFCNVYAPGESLAADDSADALQTLNDLLESLSTDQASVYASGESVFSYVGGQYRYTIGNYDAGTFAGTVTNGSPTITGVTVPTNMVARGDLTGTGIPTGTTILSFNAGAGTVTMSANATLTPGAPLQIAYTIPGDFKTERPLRITQAFTRITTQGSGLDYPIDIIDQGQYTRIGFKAISAPWPIALWYNPAIPLGELFFYQNPSGGGEVHLYTDTILSNLASLTTQVVMPQGYNRYLKRKLARELAPEYGAEWTPQMEKLAKEAEDYVRSLNSIPTPVSRYDSELTQGARTDAGWIMYGGFR
jgi:hypothetical protein